MTSRPLTYVQVSQRELNNASSCLPTLVKLSVGSLLYNFE